jgi:cytochrome c oxidase assembly factor CtaG
MLTGWRFDPFVLMPALAALAAYAGGVVAYRRVRRRSWPAPQACAFAAGTLSAWLAVESPLDTAGDARFAPHMLQHLILTDVSAPLVLLGAPVLLALATLPHGAARRLVRVLRSRTARVLTSPPVAWTSFIGALWLVHLTGFFEAALDDETLHVLEHGLFFGTALLFWLPLITLGPTPWSDEPLAYPLRMLYLFVAMPAEGLLGFILYAQTRVLYPHYAAAGLQDQHYAGELMWIGASLAMFAAFMAEGVAWARTEQARDARELERFREAQRRRPSRAPEAVVPVK